MKIKLIYNPTERQKDIICLMQGYLGVIYASGSYVFQSWTWGLV